MHRTNRPADATILAANGIGLEYLVLWHAHILESVLPDDGTRGIHTLVFGEAITGRVAFSC